MRTISIILPFFKYKHYFKECLQNLAQSTFKDFELIVVLDHPTEDIDDLLEEYKKMADAYKMEVEKIKELLGDRELEQMKKDMAVQKAVTLIADEAKEA